MDNGNVWPETVAVVLWGTDNIKTYGESLAQVSDGVLSMGSRYQCLLQQFTGCPGSALVTGGKLCPLWQLADA